MMSVSFIKVFFMQDNLYFNNDSNTLSFYLHSNLKYVYSSDVDVISIRIIIVCSIYSVLLNYLNHLFINYVVYYI